MSHGRAAAAGRTTVEPGPAVHPPQAARRARAAAPTRSSASCGRSSARCRASRVFLQNPPAIHIGGRASKSLYQFTLQSVGHRRRSTGGAGACERRAARAARARRTSPATCRSGTRRSTSRSTATAPPRSASPPSRSRRALYDAYGSRQVSTIYTPNNQYWVIDGAAAGVPARPVGARACCTSARRAGTLVPLGCVATPSPTASGR